VLHTAGRHWQHVHVLILIFDIKVLLCCAMRSILVKDYLFNV
jgi:hypothetical protein